jgi:hypothetical protein
MNCPHCGKPISPGAMLGSITTEAKRASNAANARNPRPNAKGKKKPRKATARMGKGE